MLYSIHLQPVKALMLFFYLFIKYVDIQHTIIRLTLYILKWQGIDSINSDKFIPKDLQKQNKIRQNKKLCGCFYCVTAWWVMSYCEDSISVIIFIINFFKQRLIKLQVGFISNFIFSFLHTKCVQFGTIFFIFFLFLPIFLKEYLTFFTYNWPIIWVYNMEMVRGINIITYYWALIKVHIRLLI